MQTYDKPVSLLTPIGYRNNSCGYCGNKSGSFSYYASFISLSPEFYQALLNRGWRRSGSLLYKPDQSISCCPHYTIRLDSHSFHASKDQRQALNRFNKYIVGESYTKEAARLYPKSRDQAKKRNTDFDLVERAHESEKEQLKTPPEPAHAFTVTLESDNYTEEKYSLFENYQRIVHHEPPHQISKSGFKNFLCSSPLQSKQTFHRGERRLGSYHQCYRLDGQLIAIGVLDLLPECISAVYFMYHQSVHQYSFGKVGALREIALAKEEGYQWWYSGFYIHSCVKMRYKGDYAPQYMLDPESYDWDLLDDRLKKRLGEKKFVSLSRERTVGALIEEENPMNSRSVDASADPIVTDNTPDYSASDPDSDAPVPNASLPLFLRGMPGILTKTQLQRDVDLDHINLQIQGTEAETCDLVSWDTSSIDNPHSIKGIIAELVAAVGPELGRQMLVSFD